MSSADWDGIILGAGHNALVLQAHLGKAGGEGEARRVRLELEAARR